MLLLLECVGVALASCVGAVEMGAVVVGAVGGLGVLVLAFEFPPLLLKPSSLPFGFLFLLDLMKLSAVVAKATGVPLGLVVTCTTINALAL